MEHLHESRPLDRAREQALRSGAAASAADSPQGQVIAWIQDSCRVAELAAAGAAEVLPLFWIRIYGVLTEVADFIELTTDQVDDSCVFPLARLGSDNGAARDVMAALRAVYTKGELLYIEYRRHLETHPLHSRYRARRAGSRSTTLVPSALVGGVPVTVEAAEAAFSQLRVKYGWDEERIGMEFAARAASLLRELEVVSRGAFTG